MQIEHQGITKKFAAGKFVSMIVCVAFLLASISTFCQTENEWTLKKDKNDIKVYTRQAEDSDIIEIKVLSIVQATVNQISKLLADVENYNLWMPNVKSTKVIELINKNELYYYIELNAPWPISNRDNIIHFRHTLDQKTGIARILVNGVADYLPENKGVVRITHSTGIWELSPMENGEVKVISTYVSDPAGKLPLWVIKLFVVDSIYDTFINLKKLMKDDH